MARLKRLRKNLSGEEDVEEHETHVAQRVKPQTKKAFVFSGHAKYPCHVERSATILLAATRI